MASLTYGKELLICLHLLMAGNWNKQGVHVTLMWLAALSSGLVVLWCAVQYFEDILKTKMERVDKAYW